MDFNKDAPHSTTTVDIDEEEKLENLSAELLRLHHKFNHISFGKIKALARLGIVNPKLANRVMEPPSQGPVPASSETLVASLSHTPLGIQLVSKGVDCRSMPTISKHRSSLDTQYVFMVSWPRVRSKQGLTMAKWTYRDPNRSL